MTAANPSFAREFEAALAWWRAAGVDCDFADDATVWLSEAPQLPVAQGAGHPAGTAPARRNEAPPDRAAPIHKPASATPAALPPAVIRRNLLGDSPPADLPAFRAWWCSAPELDAGRTFPRIPPRGEPGAALMVLVPQPDEHDRAHLLEGPQGRLLANILAAMGLNEGQVYIASALPCHTPMADLGALAAGGMDAVLAHHVTLARPQRLLALGAGLAPMLATPVAGADATPLREINHNGANVPVMISEALDAMMALPQLKARFWKRWIEWSAAR